MEEKEEEKEAVMDIALGARVVGVPAPEALEKIEGEGEATGRAEGARGKILLSPTGWRVRQLVEKERA